MKTKLYLSFLFLFVFSISFSQVGIGTTTPDALLHVASGGNTATSYTAKFNSSPAVAGSGGVVFTSTESPHATGYKWHTSGTGVGTFADDHFVLSSITLSSGNTNINNILNILGDGNIGLGTDTPTARLSVNGTANKSGGGAWAVFSDLRSKENIEKYTYGLNKLMKINPVKFNYKIEFGWGTKTYVGLIAQEIQEVVPTMVTEKEVNGIEDFKEVDPNELTYILINSIKEQQALIEAQKIEIENLTADNNSKAIVINDLQASIDKVDVRLQKLETLLIDAVNQ